jgi:hypothetical protein
MDKNKKPSVITLFQKAFRQQALPLADMDNTSP